MFHFFIHQIILCSTTLNPFSLYCCLGLPQSRCSTLHLAILKIMMFTSAHLSRLSRSRWMVPLPSVVSTTLAWCHPQTALWPLYSEQRPESSLPHLMCFCGLSSQGWKLARLQPLAETQGRAVRLPMSLHDTMHQSLSDCWILLSLVISSHNLVTCTKRSSSWACLHPWHPTLTSVPWGTSKDLGGSVPPREVHLCACVSLEQLWLPILGCCLRPLQQVLNIFVSIECCTLFFPDEKKEVHLSLAPCLPVLFAFLLVTCNLFMCGGLPPLLPILPMPSQLLFQELVAPGGSWLLSPCLWVSPVSESPSQTRSLTPSQSVPAAVLITSEKGDLCVFVFIR